MDRRELLDRAAHSPEERLLLSRVWDKCEQCRTRNIPTATGFLSPAEQAAAQGFLVLLDPSMTDFLLQNWDSAGREKLTVTPLPLSALAVPHAAVKELRDTVSSLRLDNVLAAGFSLSRGRAAEAVEKGSVQVNYVTCVKPGKPVSAGDTITCRGLGKCVLDSVGAPTKKGRLPVDIRRYI